MFLRRKLSIGYSGWTSYKKQPGSFLLLLKPISFISISIQLFINSKSSVGPNVKGQWQVQHKAHVGNGKHVTTTQNFNWSHALMSTTGIARCQTPEWRWESRHPRPTSLEFVPRAVGEPRAR